MTITDISGAKITFLINGGTYVLQQNLENPVTIEDERTIESAKSSIGPKATYATNMQQPFIVTCEAMNVNKAIARMFYTCFEENLKHNPDYRFKVVVEGKNNHGEDVKVSFSDCNLKQSPIQTELGQSLAVMRIIVDAGEMEWK